MNKILVIAFKFNDVLYASSTEEFRDADERHLLIFTAKGGAANFPLLGEFSKVITRRVDVNRFQQLASVAYLLYTAKLDSDYAFVLLANPFLIITKFIFSRVCFRTAVLIEDGAMNYYNFQENRSFLKRVVERILNANSFHQKIQKTYLLRPESARCFFGDKKNIDVSIFKKIKPSSLSLEVLNCKKILLGGGVIEYFDKATKFKIIKKLISDYCIDVYIPHHAFPEAVAGVKNISPSDFGVTLECILPLIDKSVLYSFGSTVVLNAKALNKEVNTVLFKLPPSGCFNDIYGFYKLMEASADTVVHVENN